MGWLKGFLGLETQAPQLDPPNPPEQAAQPEPPKGPYRDPPEAGKDLPFTFKVRGEDGRDPDVVNRCVQKAERRARRFFRGKEVRHRVTKREGDAIEFAFFRRSGRTLHVRVTRDPRECG